MPLITLTTDFGTKDHFVGAIKGAIYNELDDAKIIDISHQLSEENKHIALLLDDHYFVCPDNGVISMIASDIKPEKIVEITIHDRLISSFNVLDVFVKVACHIARGGTLEVIGKSIHKYIQITEVQPLINDAKTQIVGSIIYIDNYGNVISNISKKLFQDIGKGRNFEVIARNYIFPKIQQQYNEIVNFKVDEENRQDDGKRLAIFNSANFLEIAVYRSNLKTVGGASSLLGLDYRDTITVRFN